MPEKAKSDHIASRAHGLLGSLKDALAAASREDTGAAGHAGAGGGATRITALPAVAGVLPPPVPVEPAGGVKSIREAEAGMASGATEKSADKNLSAGADRAPNVPSAEDAAREVRGSVTLRPQERHVEFNEPPTTRVVRKSSDAKGKERLNAKDGPSADEATEAARTQLVRGRQKLERSDFTQDPVVGWLVVVGGPGLGAFRPIFEGNNTLGRASSQRISINFGDDAISSEEQAYIRYDSADRSFLFVPNLAKTNVVSVNDKRPTGAVELAHIDVITVGRTQLVFVPFCGPDFDWAELAEVKD